MAYADDLLPCKPPVKIGCKTRYFLSQSSNYCSVIGTKSLGVNAVDLHPEPLQIEWTMSDSDLTRNIRLFSTTNWTRSITEDPAYVAVPSPSRESKGISEHALISETLNTRHTIGSWLTMQKKPAAGDTLITETHTLLSLGPGVSGYPGILHGSMVGLVVDETTGTLLQLNADAGDPDFNGFIVTASLKTTFMRPIPVPSIILVTTRFRERTGHKWYIDATIRDEANDVLALGETLWVRTRGPQAKL